MKPPLTTPLFGFLFALLLVSCSKEDEVTYQLKTKAVQLYSGKTFTLEVQPASSGWSYSSKNSNIASVTDSGVVTTHCVGTTMIYVRHAKGLFVDSLQVTVNPKITLYQDPYLEFFSTEETVKNNETGTFEVRIMSDGNTLWYTKEIYTVVYHFNVSNVYDYSEVRLSTYYLIDEIYEHVSERYLFLCTKNYTYINHNFVDKHYISPDSSKIICVSQWHNNQNVIFHPYTIQAMEAIQNDTVGRVFYDL